MKGILILHAGNTGASEILLAAGKLRTVFSGVKSHKYEQQH
jgi:hypothetical protein